MDTDVLVIGAGPTGLILASELHLAGVSVTLVDRLPERSTLSKAGGVQSRTLEALDQRGLLEPLLATGDHPVAPAHFSGIHLPLHVATSRQPWRHIPQVVIEGFLIDHLAAKGIQVRRGHELTGLDQDTDGVTATFANGTTIRAAYLAGADGGHSTVRSLVGAEFTGRPGTENAIASDVRLTGPELPTHSRAENGRWAMVFPIGVDEKGRPLRRLVLAGTGQSKPRHLPVTEEEIREGLLAIFGSTVELAEVRYAYRITNAALQAREYRYGRVFLAGDAAHTHLPIGAQGMNAGIQDAMNLGWKLGAAARGTAPDGLLDSYHGERHPAGAAVLRTVQAQSMLMDWAGGDSPDLPPLRDLFGELFELPAVQRFFSLKMAGLAVRYGTDEHPLVGYAARDLDLPEYGGARLHELLRTGHGLLVDPDGEFAKQADLWSDRVDHVVTGVATEPMLIRPDGYICWAGRDGNPEAALNRWFGEPLR